MKLTPDTPDSNYLITHCDENKVEINGETYSGNIVVGKETLLINQLGATPENTTVQQWEQIWQERPEIVLVGTSLPLSKLSAKLQPLFYSRNIGFEIMPAPAACRTLTVLLAEHRHVLATLFFE